MDVVRGGRGEEDGGAGDVGGLAPAAGGDAVEDRLVAVGVGAQGLGVVGLDVARRDGVDVDAASPPTRWRGAWSGRRRRAWRRCRTGTRMPPWKASSEAMLTMAPPACRAKAARAKAWERKNTALRLTSITSSQSASVKSTASARRMMPALLTRMSSGPSVGERRRRRRRVVEGEREARGPSGPRPAISAERLVERASGRRRSTSAPARGQAEGDRLADAGVGAGDQRAPAVEAEGVAHRRSRPSPPCPRPCSRRCRRPSPR